MRSYVELPKLEGLGLPHAWDEFGPDDQLGTIGLLTPERKLAALGLAREGLVFNLSLPLNYPKPPMFGRKPYEHVIFTSSRNNQDDYVNGLYLQGSSQWDGLRHVRAREFGFFGGRKEDQVGSDGSELGIERWVEHGIVGRAVLLDLPRYFDRIGKTIDPMSGDDIPVEDLQGAAKDQGIAFQTGDILLIRTGWMRRYLGATDAERQELAEHRQWAGLRGDEAMAAFLWDNHFAAVAADNPAIENGPGDPNVGSLHRRVVPLMGLALGELWVLEGLAAHASEKGRWESCLVSVPLNLPGGVGSPANAIAIM